MGFVVFSRRSFGYKLGLVLLFCGTIIFIMAFASPYWYKLHAGLVYVHGGLWQNCVQVLLLRMCAATTRGTISSTWMCVVQSLQCTGLIGLLMACMYGVSVNWIQRKPNHSRMLEILGIISSLLGFAGAVFFIIQMESNTDELKKLTTSIQIKGKKFHHTIAWALGLSLASGMLCLIASIIIVLHNPGIPPEDVPDVIGYTDPETGAVYPVIDTGNQEVYYIPPPVMPMAGGFQPVTSAFQPPAYETVLSTPAYVPPYTPYAAK